MTLFGVEGSNQPPWGAYRPGALASLAILASRHTPLGRGSGRRALFKLLEATHQGPVDVRVNGCPMRLYPTKNVFERKALLRPDRHDPVEKSMLRRAMSKLASIFVDIGANAGIYSLEAAIAAGEGSRIIAVEPNTELIARLKFNEQLARSEGLIAPTTSIEIYSGAISDRDGESFLAEAGEEGSRYLSDHAGIPVPTKTLLSLAGDFGLERITALKIDIEGHEDRALVPFFAAADDKLLPNLIIMEHGSSHLWQTDCVSVCEARGYRVSTRTRNNVILTL